MTTAHLTVGLLGLTAVVMAALAVFAYRNRQVPGAVPFTLLMASLAVWTGGYVPALLTPHEGWRLFWENVQWVGTVYLEVGLLLFALAYTGYDRHVTRRTVSLLLVVPTVVLVLFWTNPAHHLMYTDADVVVAGGLSLVEFTYGTGFWLYAIFSYSLVIASFALLVRLLFVSEYLYADQSLLFAVGIVSPFAANIVDNLVFQPAPVVDLTPFAFAVTGIAFSYAVYRRQLFDLVPATRQLGRRSAISQLDAGIVIVDGDRRVVYCNEAAGAVLDIEPVEALGREVRSLVDDDRIDFGTEDALAEIERDDHTYEIRTSPISDRRDRPIGHTLVVHDVTARKRREEQLARQRDELATVNDLNAVIRGVNRALVSATSREQIERAVCDQVATADLYRSACIGDLSTWTGNADRWLVAGDDVGPAPSAFAGGDVRREDLEGTGEPESRTLVPAAATAEGTWLVVPVVYGMTVYGALGLYTDRENVSERERAVLGELGATVGHAINAVETRRLLSADAVVELDIESRDADDPLVAATADLDCTLEVAGIVPTGEEGHAAYVRLDGPATTDAREQMDAATAGTLRPVRDSGDLLEWHVTGDTLLGSLVAYGANVLEARTEDGRARVSIEMASDADVRTLVDHVEGGFSATNVLAKRERTRPVDEPAALPGETLADLTDRQREVMEAAYRAGYFNWPRDSTAENVAETLDIAAPTLHAHLRKAESSLFADLFDGRANAESGPARE